MDELGVVNLHFSANPYHTDWAVRHIRLIDDTEDLAGETEQMRKERGQMRWEFGRVCGGRRLQMSVVVDDGRREPTKFQHLLARLTGHGIRSSGATSGVTGMYQRIRDSVRLWHGRYKPKSSFVGTLLFPTRCMNSNRPSSAVSLPCI
jgi:hypothetical protein